MKKLSAVLVVAAFIGLLALPQPAAAGVQPIASAGTLEL